MTLLKSGTRLALLLSSMPITNSFAQTDPTENFILPQKGSRQGSSEFYSSNPSNKLMFPVHVFGDIGRPGLYYVPLGSTLMDAISMAGGPGANALTSEIRIRSIGENQKEREVSLFGKDGNMPLNSKDVIVVDRSIKADLPLIFGAVSLSMSIATFFMILAKK